MFSSWPWTRDIRPRGLQRRPWTMERFLFSPTQDTPEAKTATSRGNTHMILSTTPIPCPCGGILRHTTTDRKGKRTYRSTPAQCRNCPCKAKCGANKEGQRVYTTHIWQEYLDIVEDVRKTDLGKRIYARRKETIERVFADAKEKHAMRYTHHRGLTRVSAWVRLKYAAMNLKKLALWKWSRSDFFVFLPYFFFDTTKTPALA